MMFTIYSLLIQYGIFYNQYYFLNGEPIMGQNVRQALVEEFPYIVAITYIPPGNLVLSRDLVCSGTLISQEDVLTAEHCFNQVNSDTGIQILIGSIDLFGGSKYFANWWITYDQWAVASRTHIQYAQNDIAIIRLLNSLPDETRPAMLSTEPTISFYERNVIVAGWGKNNNNEVSRMLQTATTTVLLKENCDARISRAVNEQLKLDERYLCSVAEPYVFLNFGDSGGPLIYEDKIVAVNKGTCPRRLVESEYNINEINAHLGIEYYGNFILHVMYYC